MSAASREYLRRRDAIIRNRSLTHAAEELGLRPGTLGKWYHLHRDEFPPSVQQAIRSNIGHHSGPWVEDVPRPRIRHDADTIVSTIFQMYHALKIEKERLEAENRKLRKELARAQVPADVTAQLALVAATRR